MRKFLEHGPYTLLEASTGPEGVRAAQENRPDVILLDFLLWDMTAFDVLDEVKADPRTREIPVVIITSHTLDTRERERLASQTDSIVSKDKLSRELAMSRIRDALRKAGVGHEEPAPKPTALRVAQLEDALGDGRGIKRN